MRFLRDNAAFLAAGFLLSFSSSYGQTYFIAIFAGDIQSDYALSHGAWGLLYTLSTTVSAAAMIWAGALTDRFRARTLVVGVAAALSAACLAMSLAQTVPALALAVFGLRLAGQGMMSQLSIVSIARWFVATRGLALSISSMGFSLGQASLPVLFVALMAFTDWRTLWLLAGAMMLATLPVIWALLRLERTPQALALEAEESAGLGGVHWTRGRVVGHWLFWALVPAVVGPPTWGTALFFWQVHLSDTKPWDLIAFVALLPLYTAAQIGGTFASGWAVDRTGAMRLLPVYAAPFVAGFAILAAAQSLPAAALGLILIGAGNGMQSTVPVAFWAEAYGTRHLGGIKALSVALMVFGSAVGPGVSGVLIDRGVVFETQMWGIVAYFAAAGALATLATRRVRRMRRPTAAPGRGCAD